MAIKLPLRAFEAATGVRFTLNHTGKMAGMISLSSSPLSNPRCVARACIPGTACEGCYANRVLTYYPKCINKFDTNGAILSAAPLEFTPALDNYRYIRLEAFGDLLNAQHAANYIEICYANPDTRFALWTKNPDYLREALLECGKPSNLVIVYSSLYLNEPAADEPAFADHIFTVYNKGTTADINCGARSCISCLKCYRRRGEDGCIKYINELLK